MKVYLEGTPRVDDKGYNETLSYLDGQLKYYDTLGIFSAHVLTDISGVDGVAKRVQENIGGIILPAIPSIVLTSPIDTRNFVDTARLTGENKNIIIVLPWKVIKNLLDTQIEDKENIGSAGSQFPNPGVRNRLGFLIGE